MEPASKPYTAAANTECYLDDTDSPVSSPSEITHSSWDSVRAVIGDAPPMTLLYADWICDSVELPQSRETKVMHWLLHQSDSVVNTAQFPRVHELPMESREVRVGTQLRNESAPQREPNQLMPVVFLASCLSTEEHHQLVTLAKMMGATVEDDFSERTTHLVVMCKERNAIRRTIKYLFALAAGLWIISMEWVHACIAKKRVLEMEPYEALDKVQIDAPRRSRLGATRVFCNLTFYLESPYQGRITQKSLEDLLKFAGARVLREGSNKIDQDSLIVITQRDFRPRSEFTCMYNC